jgi:signal transduction histidine kinase
MSGREDSDERTPNTPHGGVTISQSGDTPRGTSAAKATRVEPGGRINVELRILCFLAFLWLSVVGQAAVWTWVLVDGSHLAELDWPTVILPPLAGLLVTLGVVVSKFPSVRWVRRGSLVNLPSPVPLAIVGFPALVLYPVLGLRDRNARAQPKPSGEDIELAFRQLLVLPRSAALSFLTWMGAAFVLDAMLIAEQTTWPHDTVLALTGLWLALLAPYAVIVSARSRAILRPEYLSAPRPRNVTVPTIADLRTRLTVPAVAAVLAAVISPLLAGWVGSEAVATQQRDQAARQVAQELVDVAEKNDAQALGRFLGGHSGISLVDGDTVYGSPLPVPPAELIAPWTHRDADGKPELFVLEAASLRAVVPVEPVPRMPKSLLLIGFVTLAAFGSTAIFLIARDVARDVDRATRQVSAVAAGEVPLPLTEGSFSTRELRQLVQSVDRLVTRITETNVAKYVAIEKAQEADRLKSQFLANMSHDLRSPLNSIIGFSELLTTGIDGELTPDQNEMVQIIHGSGRELLQQIDDILDTAKIEAGRMELHPEPTPPAALVSRAIQNARKRQEKPIEYPTETAAGLPPAFVDPYRTSQAIENVLVFGAELLDDGEIRIQVRPGTSDGARMICIRIETPRAPATAEQLTEVLRGFYRIPGHRGLGLALPIAGSILELQGGTLGIEEVGEGMAFNLQLPAPEARVKMRLRDR